MKFCKPDTSAKKQFAQCFVKFQDPNFDISHQDTRASISFLFVRSRPCAQCFVTFQDPNFDISDPDTRAPISIFFFTRTLVKLHFSENFFVTKLGCGFIVGVVSLITEIFCHFGPRWWIFVSPISF